MDGIGVYFNQSLLKIEVIFLEHQGRCICRKLLLSIGAHLGYIGIDVLFIYDKMYPKLHNYINSGEYIPISSIIKGTGIRTASEFDFKSNSDLILKCTLFRINEYNK